MGVVVVVVVGVEVVDGVGVEVVGVVVVGVGVFFNCLRAGQSSRKCPTWSQIKHLDWFDCGCDGCCDKLHLQKKDRQV